LRILKERAISNRLYLSEGRSHKVATNGRRKRSLCSTNRAGLSRVAIDPFLGIFVATVIILEVKLKRPVGQFQASLTKLSALLQVVVQFRYNI